jgi:hypothetical protein
MKGRTQYQEFAERCDQLAREVKAEHHRKILKEMAEAWRKLDAEADPPEPEDKT